MSMQIALRKLLRSNTTIANACGERVRPVTLAPDEQGPSIVYMVRQDTRVLTMDGQTAEDDGDARLELTIRSRDYDQVVALRDAAVELLHGFSGVRDGFDLTIFYDDQTDDTIYADPGEELPEFRQAADFRVMYSRST